MTNPAAAARCLATMLMATTCILAVNFPTRAAPVSYAVDPKHTYASFEIDHLGFSTTRGTFDMTTGSITLDSVAASGKIEIVIETASIDTGLAKRDEHLRAREFFNVKQYPTMTFVATSLRFDGDRLIAAHGQLTMLGKTLPVSLDITRFNCGQHPIRKKPACGADVVTTIRRSDWGMTTYVPAIGNEVTIRIGVEAIRIP